MARSPIEWVDGDPKWSRVWTAVEWALLANTVLFMAVITLNLLWQFGTISSAQTGFLSWIVPISWLQLWVWLGLDLVLVFPAVAIRTRKPVFKVAPTDRGLAVRLTPFWIRIVPWTDIRWKSATRVEFIQLLGTGRVTVTQEQSQRIYRWFHPQ